MIGVRRMKGIGAFGLGIFLFMQPVCVAAGAPGDQVRQTVDKLLAILKDPRLKQESRQNERREELISLVNNYRAQFGRVLASSSYQELVHTMKEKTLGS